MYIPGLKNKFKIIRIIFRLYYIFCILMLLVGVSQDIIQGIVIFLLLIIPVYIFSGLLRGIKHYKDKCWLWCNLVCPFIAFILCCIVFLSYNERLVLDAANNLGISVDEYNTVVDRYNYAKDEYSIKSKEYSELVKDRDIYEQYENINKDLNKYQVKYPESLIEEYNLYIKEKEYCINKINDLNSQIKIVTKSKEEEIEEIEEIEVVVKDTVTNNEEFNTHSYEEHVINEVIDSNNFNDSNYNQDSTITNNYYENSNNNDYYDNSSNNDYYSSTGTLVYIAAGNRYYHKTANCKFISGAVVQQVYLEDHQDKFECNCWKY